MAQRVAVVTGGMGGIGEAICMRLAQAEHRGRQVVYRVADAEIAGLLDMARRLALPNCEHLAACRRIGPDWV